MPAPRPVTIPVGGIPLNLAPTPDGSAVYVTVFDSRLVRVIDPVTGTVRATITVGRSPRGLVVSPDGATLYVANLGDDTVSVVDTATGTVPATINVGRNPQGVALTTDGTRLYVTNSGGDPTMPGSVGVYTTADRKQVGSAIQVGKGPAGVGASAWGLVYVANANSNTVTVIDDAGGAPVVVAELPVGPSPLGVAAHRDGSSRAYVTHFEADSISVLDAIGGGPAAAVVATVTVGRHPRDIALSADEAFVYVANTDSGTLSVLATTTLSVNTVPIGGRPSAVALLPDGGTYTVADSAARTVVLANRSFTPVGGTPAGIAVTGDRAYVTDDEAHTLDVLDLGVDPPTRVSQLALGVDTFPTAVVVTADGRTALVTRRAADDVAVIDLNVDPPTITATVPVVSVPANIAITPDDRRAFVVGRGTNGVTVLDLTTSPPTVVTTLDVEAPSDVAVSPDGARAFVTQTIARENVTVVDCTTDPPQVITALASGGIAPSAVAVTPDARWVLVVNTDPGNVTVLNNTTDPPSWRDLSFAIGQRGWDIAISPDGRRAYVACNTLDVASRVPLAVLDLTLDESRPPTTSTIPVGRGQTGVAVTADSTRVVVAHNDPRLRGVAVVPVPGRIRAGRQPRDVVISADGSRLYVADMEGAVVFVDRAAPPGTLFATVPVGQSPARLALTPDERLLVVTEFSPRLFLVPMAAGPPPPPLPLPDVPFGLAISPDSRSCYVTLGTTGDLLGLDLTADPPRPTFRLPAVGGEIVLTTDGKRAYVGQVTDQKIGVVDLAAAPPRVVSSVPVGSAPGSLTLTADGTRLYALLGDGGVAVVDTATLAATRMPITLFRPLRAAVSPDGKTLLVTGDTGPGTLWTIDVATGEIVGTTTPAGAFPAGIAFSRDGSLSYLTEPDTGTIAIRPVRGSAYVP